VVHFRRERPRRRERVLVIAMKRHRPVWSLLGAVVLLALPARTAHGAESARAWRPATDRALEFEITGGTLTDFDGGTISLRRQHGEHAVWRFGCDVSGVHSRSRVSGEGSSTLGTSETNSVDSYRLTAQLTRLTFPWPERRLRPWLGAALGGGTSHDGTGQASESVSTSKARGIPVVYIAALAGLEYAITPHFAAHAQYAQGTQYSKERTRSAYGGTSSVSGSGNDDLSTNRWQLYSTGARFGVAAFY
jgi:hypothetical protein